MQVMTVSWADFRSCALQEGASYDFHDIAVARDNDIGTIPKRALLETNRRRDALSSAMSHSSRRSVRATERGSVLPERMSFVARHLSSFPYVRLRIVSFLAGVLSYEEALKGNRTGCLVREKAKCYLY